ncbi:MAG TPA: PKD domain-containing protein [Flavisolibacter sp.]|nr:PKD domain-containing protein [Flavisolibacter sp.]
MKKLFLLLLICFSTSLVYANHITGGEMFYTFVDSSNGKYRYQVTLKLYRDCFSTGAPLDGSAPIAIFRNSDGSMIWNGLIPMSQSTTLQLDNPDPCIDNPPAICYEVGYYTFTTIALPAEASGYTVSYQRCCRITGINNLIGSSSVGATYSAQIPGTTRLADAPKNNSARFVGEDRVIICANNAFCYDFGAVDPDKFTEGDSLSYSFCPAVVGGSTGDPAPNPPAGPPYGTAPYASPFSSGAPLGNNVTIDPRTGMVCGIAPAVGIYVVTVCVTEWRKGMPIATQRKDLQIKVGDCNLADASLKPEYISCDGFTFNFRNEAPPTPLVKTYFWDFGDGNTSTLATPAHTYADTGTYTFKLVINRGDNCSDSAVSRIKVYPGFFPGFTSTGICLNKPTRFFDTTKTRYGFVNTWKWDFGVAGDMEDISTDQNPVYTYTQTGTYPVRFIVTNSKGCIDTVFKDITIIDKPPITLPFEDTLICNGDRLQLHAQGTGTFSWTPNTNIINANTADPTVFPAVTTSYIVELNESGCINHDTVQVRVVDFVTLQARPDTIICLTDSVQLGATGDGLQYSWSPAATINDPNLQNPMAKPGGTTTFQVTATIGGCNATDNVTVRTIPYPGANAGADTVVCYRTSAQLNASVTGNSFTWSPASSLSNPNILNPIASPAITTQYVLTVFDNNGCPKPGRDTVLVTVLPQVNAYAGKDTSVVLGQPLQFNASGGETYEWIPNTGLSRDDIFNPIGIYDGSFDSIRYKVIVTDAYNCFDSAFVNVKVFRTFPQIFVPTAFTPNRDGKNDLFRPIAVGISKIEYFRVFNRWGELVFSTTTNEMGWDGRIKGKDQATGTFVWVVKAVDYTGKEFFAKGTVTLIR